MKSHFRMQSNYEILGRLIQMDRVIQASIDDKFSLPKEHVDMAFYTSGWRFVESLFSGLTSIGDVEPVPGKLEERVWDHLRNAIHQWGTAPIVDISDRHLAIKYVGVESKPEKVVVRISIRNDMPGILEIEGSPYAQRIFVEKEVDFERYMIIEALARGIQSQEDDPEPANEDELLNLCNVVYKLPRDHNENIRRHLAKCIDARIADPNKEFLWEFSGDYYTCAGLNKTGDPFVYTFRNLTKG